ncbi:restriction endonuclease subunit S [Lactococcus lactis]|uniref:restriction endonuclease subunit S n=1 Tax=Lactococcus lactis TaxID=1358 RepID=UPI003D09E826
MMSKKSPQLRFEGFTDDWEERKLGDEFKKVNERNNGSFGREHWISVANMYFQDPEKVQSNNINTRTYVMRIGDMAFEGNKSSKFKYGRFVVNDIGNGVVSELFPIYRHNNEYDNSYWKNAIQIERIMAPIFAKAITSSGVSSNKLDNNHFLNQKICIPPLKEQQKIGSFFKQLDDTIALHQRKLDLLKEQKKGYLQKMFPKNGAKVPELRFAGFADDWEERKLGQYTKLITKGTTPKDKTGIGDVNFVKVENITNGKIYPINKIKQHEHDNYLKRSRLEEKDILFSIAGTLGRTAIVNKSILPANTNQALAIIRGYDFDTNFLITSLAGNVVKEYIRRNPTVGAQPNLSLEQVGNLLVNTPNAEEQQKVGSFFKQLDDTIALHQRKLDLLKEQKKGFLQKMFV